MAAYTNITTGVDWQDVDVINEIITSYQQHRMSVGEPKKEYDAAPIYAVPVGYDIQARNFWYDIQLWMENFCTYFVDPDETIVGEASITMFTLATWRAAAGISVANGYKRSTDGTTIIYGKMVVGDVIGPWIMQEIQAGLSALTQTVENSTGGDETPVWVGNETDGTCTTALADTKSEYTSSGGGDTAWDSNSNYEWFRFVDQGTWQFIESAQHGTLKSTVVYDPGVAFTWVLYSKPQTIAEFGETPVYKDGEGLFSGFDVYAQIDTGSEAASTTTIESANIGGASKPGHPLEVATAMDCSSAATLLESCKIAGGSFVCEWAWSYV